MQVAAVEALTTVVEAQLIAAGDIVDLLLPTVLSSINVVGSPDEVGSKRSMASCFCASVAAKSDFAFCNNELPYLPFQ